VRRTLTETPIQPPNTVFVARDLSKTYGSGEAAVHALRGLDRDVAAGEFVVLLRPSSSGKFTLHNILGGLDTPTAARVAWRDHELTGASEAELTKYRRAHIGFVFQFYNLIPSLTARENVELVAEIAADPMSSADALDAVGLRLALTKGSSELRRLGVSLTLCASSNAR
jgi:putative ABC transport system ATP-binding protein